MQRFSVRRHLASLIAIAILAACAAVVVTPWVLMSRSHSTWMRCTVTSARGGQTSGGRFSGGPAVFITTGDCGELLYQWKITKDNRDAVARRFQPGKPYDFLISPLDRWIATHHPLSVKPDVWDFRRATR